MKLKTKIKRRFSMGLSRTAFFTFCLDERIQNLIFQTRSQKISTAQASFKLNLKVFCRRNFN